MLGSLKWRSWLGLCWGVAILLLHNMRCAVNMSYDILCRVTLCGGIDLAVFYLLCCVLLGVTVVVPIFFSHLWTCSGQLLIVSENNVEGHVACGTLLQCLGAAPLFLHIPCLFSLSSVLHY
jgi:hypothetical protein